jgi:hypothetical protein
MCCLTVGFGEMRFSWKSHSQTTGDEGVIRIGRKLKPKYEKFSFTNFKWDESRECDDDDLKTLQTGLKLLIRANNSENDLGFDNCIIWLAKESPSLDIWIPSTGDHQVIFLSDIHTITKMSEESILNLKCSNGKDYEFKIMNDSRLERLRLILKMATAKSAIFIPSNDPLQTPDKSTNCLIPLSQNSLSLEMKKSEDDENTDPHRDQYPKLRINSGQQFSLRSPKLNSPACLEERVGARSRFRVRASLSMHPTPQSSNILDSKPSRDLTHEKSPKRSISELETDSGQLPFTLTTPKKKVKSTDCDIINNETISL